jgi:hypothetical protein
MMDEPVAGHQRPTRAQVQSLYHEELEEHEDFWGECFLPDNFVGFVIFVVKALLAGNVRYCRRVVQA